MSPRDGEEFGEDLLAAKERDLAPLRDECIELLDLDADKTAVMHACLETAWFSGLRAGRDLLEAQATQPEPDVYAVVIPRFELEFKDLMEEAANRLNLSVPETMSVWGLLHRAWVAAKDSASTELMALYVELNTDVAEEVRRWLEERDAEPPQDEG